MFCDEGGKAARRDSGRGDPGPDRQSLTSQGGPEKATNLRSQGQSERGGIKLWQAIPRSAIDAIPKTQSTQVWFQPGRRQRTAMRSRLHSKCSAHNVAFGTRHSPCRSCRSYDLQPARKRRFFCRRHPQIGLVRRSAGALRVRKPDDRHETPAIAGVARPDR
jgi:hypothetical protein